MYLFKKRSDILLFFFILFIVNSSYSSEFRDSTNNYGQPGLLDTPISEAFSDGKLAFTSSKFGPNLRNTITFQALPRVTASFRYSGIGDQPGYFYKTSGYTNWDRSFDVHLNVIKENNFLPSISVGLKDFIGTGNFSSEYVVATKKITEKFRLSTGLGWGRLGSANIVGKVGDRKLQRTSQGGNFHSSYFTGNYGLFGGFEYLTPINNLILKYEISSDNYGKDSSLLRNTPESLQNIGIEYVLSENLNLSSFYMHEKEVGLQLSLSATPSSAIINDFQEKSPEPFYSFPINHKKNYKKIISEIIKNLKEEKIDLIAYKFEDKSINLVIKNYHFSSHVQAIGRTLRIMSRHVPSEIKFFKVTLSEYGVPITEVTFERDEIATIIDAPNAEILAKKISNVKNTNVKIKDAKVNIKSEFNWSISPYYRLHLFDPDNPVYYDIGPEIYLDYFLKPGLSMHSTIQKSTFTTFDDITRGTKGALPKVRTDLKNYLNITDTRINDFYINSFSKITRNIYNRTTIGYLESMYSGISFELLHSNPNSRLSYGIEVNYVKPRSYRQLLEFRDINGMPNINGHLSTYLQTGFFDYDAQIDIGQYLAGDKGGTFTLSRNFPSGWSVGGFFTLTDASFTAFGEGSFDKGIFFNIPFNAFTPFETRSSVYEKIRPIQGDGGQRLGVKGRLNDVVRNHSSYKYSESWNRLWR